MKVNYHVLPNSVVVNYDGKTVSMNRSDVRYDAVIQAIKDDKLDSIPSIVDVAKAYSVGGLKLKDNLLYLDNEALPESLSDRVLAFQKEGLPFEHLVKFARKLRLNPSFNSRQQLFKFLEHNGHPITTEGNFIAYRGVTSDFKDRHTGKFDNSVGSVCEVKRSEVDDNPNNTCSHGLHVACFDYAKGFGPQTIEVEVDPRDVVAVPTDYNGTKMRVCKFKVVNVAKDMRTENLVDSSYNGETNIDDSQLGYNQECDYLDTCESEDFESEEENDEDIWEEVQLKASSLINQATWNREDQTLEVAFNDGTSYEYYNVPESEISNWEDALSVGSYFMNNIAYGYQYKKL